MSRVQVYPETMITMLNEQLNMVKRIRVNCEELESHNVRMLDCLFHQLPDDEKDERNSIQCSSIKSSIDCIDLSSESNNEDTDTDTPKKKQKLCESEDIPDVNDTSILYRPAFFGGPLISSESIFQTPTERGRPRKCPYGPKRKLGRPKKSVDHSIFEMNEM